MPVNYYELYDKLMERAGHPKTPPAEAAACREKARKIMEKHLQPSYRSSNSPFTDDTIVTGRDGYPAYGSPAWDAWVKTMRAQRQAASARVAEDLLKNQWRWNSEYYDRNGNPRPTQADTDEDYVEDTYAYDPEDNEGEYYDYLQNEGWT